MTYSFKALRAVALATGILGLNLATACEPMDCDDYNCGRDGHYNRGYGDGHYRDHDHRYDRHRGGDCDDDYC